MQARGPSKGRGRPIEVLHLVSTFAIKTDTKWLLQLARHWDPAKIRSSISCFYDAGPMQDEFEALGLRTENLGIRGEMDPRGLARAYRLIRSRPVDIVHTHLLRADLLGGAAARLAGVSSVISTVYAIGDFHRAKRRRLDRVLDAACTALPTHVIAVSEAVRSDCIERLGIAANKITVIHTGIEPPPDPDIRAVAAFRREYAPGESDRLIVTLSRLSYEKGIDVLIEAARLLGQDWPKARFVVVGDGPDRKKLQRQAAERDLRHAFHFAGFLADVWPALLAADVVCMPSRSEGMPNALLEAMSASRPLVATKVGGIPEVVTNEENGLLTEPGSPAALAVAIGRLLGDGELSARLATAGKETVHGRFRVSQVAARYCEVYESLFGRHGEDRVAVTQPI